MRQSKRTVCLGLVALLLACGWGCGPKEQSDPGKDVDVAALAQAMMDADPTLPEMVTVGWSVTGGTVFRSILGLS